MTSQTYGVRTAGMRIGTVVAAAALLAGIALVLGTPGRSSAASSATADVGMPFSGKWAYNISASQPWDDNIDDSHPKAHERYSKDWATDVYATGVDVYPTVVNATGAVTLKYAGTGNNSCSTPGGVGAWVRVNVYVGADQVHVGTIQYGHLDTSKVTLPRIGSVIQPTTSLGKAKYWETNCWGVTNESGTHIHLSAWNAGSGYSCYYDLGQPGAKTVSKGTAIGKLGSNNSRPSQECASGTASGVGGEGTSSELDNHSIDFDGDGKTDVFRRAPDGQWSYSSGGVAGWRNLNKSGVTFDQLRVS